MKIEIELHTDELIAFATQHKRPIGLAQAAIGISKASASAHRTAERLKADWMSRALDAARMEPKEVTCGTE